MKATSSLDGKGLFHIFFPSAVVGPHQKKTVKYDPKATLLDTLTKECSKRGTPLDGFIVLSASGTQVPLQITLDHPDLADRLVILSKRPRSFTKHGDDLANAAWHNDLTKVKKLLAEVCVLKNLDARDVQLFGFLWCCGVCSEASRWCWAFYVCWLRKQRKTRANNYTGC